MNKEKWASIVMGGNISFIILAFCSAAFSLNLAYLYYSIGFSLFGEPSIFGIIYLILGLLGIVHLKSVRTRREVFPKKMLVFSLIIGAYTSWAIAEELTSIYLITYRAISIVLFTVVSICLLVTNYYGYKIKKI